MTGTGADTPLLCVYCVHVVNVLTCPCAGRLNHPRGDCCAAAVGGKLYVAGGWTTDYADTLGSVEVFDPTAAGGAGSWSFMPNMTLPRGDCEAVALDEDRSAGGGLGQLSGDPRTPCVARFFHFLCSRVVDRQTGTSPCTHSLGSQCRLYAGAGGPPETPGLWCCVLHRTLLVLGGVVTDGNFTASVETLDVTAASPQW